MPATGGGSGVSVSNLYRTGTITTNTSATASVTFTSQLPSADYSVVLNMIGTEAANATAIGSSYQQVAVVTAKTSSGFTIVVPHGGNVSSFTTPDLNYIAIMNQ